MTVMMDNQEGNAPLISTQEIVHYQLFSTSDRFLNLTAILNHTRLQQIVPRHFSLSIVGIPHAFFTIIGFILHTYSCCHLPWRCQINQKYCVGCTGLSFPPNITLGHIHPHIPPTNRPRTCICPFANDETTSPGCYRSVFWFYFALVLLLTAAGKCRPENM